LLLRSVTKIFASLNNALSGPTNVSRAAHESIIFQHAKHYLRLFLLRASPGHMNGRARGTLIIHELKWRARAPICCFSFFTFAPSQPGRQSALVISEEAHNLQQTRLQKDTAQFATPKIGLSPLTANFFVPDEDFKEFGETEIFQNKHFTTFTIKSGKEMEMLT
jgi:hypothetical protein